MTIIRAAQRLVDQLNAKTPRGMRGVHAVWVRTDVVEFDERVVDGEVYTQVSDHLQWICVAINPRAMSRVLGSLPTIPATIDGWPVQRVAWPDGPDVETIASYEDGSVPA